MEALMGKRLSRYENKRNQIELNWFNPDGSFNYKQINKYDDKNNLIEMSYSREKAVFKNDSIRNKIEKIYTNRTKPLSKANF